MALSILSFLKGSGERVTPARKKIVEIFSDGNLVSANDLLIILHKKGLKVNKTTIYRELEFLLNKGLVKEISLVGGKRYYESTMLEHHHHLICKNCRNSLEIKNNGLETDIKKIIQETKKKVGFKIEDHSLEFFGLCANCS